MMRKTKLPNPYSTFSNLALMYKTLSNTKSIYQHKETYHHV